MLQASETRELHCSGCKRTLVRDNAIKCPRCKTINPLPDDSKEGKASVINPDWHVRARQDGLYKELLGKKTVFHRCCGRLMRRVISYHKNDGKTRHWTEGWYCEACEKFKERGIM
jgi:phage FluMu protein Com